MAKKQTYILYDKDSFLEHMGNAIPEGTIIATTNVFDSAEVRKKRGEFKISQLHASEFFATPDSVKFMIEGGVIPLSILIVRPQHISKKYKDKLAADKGMTGFSLG